MPTVEIDKELVAALNGAKSKAHNFAIVAKGASVVYLLVSKLPIKDADVQKAKKEHGGTDVIRGNCQGSDGELVFRVAKEPAVEALKLKAFISTATKLTVKPRFEVAVDGTDDNRASNEGQTSPVASTSSADPATAFTVRLKAVKPQIDAALQSKSPLVVHVKTLVGEIAVAGKASQFEAAIGKIDLLEKLIKKMGEETSTTSSGSATPSKPAASGKSETPSEPTAPSGVEPWTLSPQFDAIWKQGKSAWEGALKNVNGQLEKLRGSLLQANDSDLKSIAEFGLNAITANHKVPLQVAIMEVDRAAGPGKIKAIDKAQDAVIAFRDHIERDERVEACDNNPFGVTVTLRSELSRGLDKLGRALDEALL